MKALTATRIGVTSSPHISHYLAMRNIASELLAIDHNVTMIVLGYIAGIIGHDVPGINKLIYHSYTNKVCQQLMDVSADKNHNKENPMFVALPTLRKLTERILCDEELFSNPRIKMPFMTVDQVLRRAELWNIDTHELIDYVKPTMPNVKLIGDLALTRTKFLSGTLKSFIDTAEQGIVLVTFGLIFPVRQVHTKKLLEAFRQLTYKIARRVDDISVASYDSDHIYTSTWVPQNDVLPTITLNCLLPIVGTVVSLKPCITVCPCLVCHYLRTNPIMPRASSSYGGHLELCIDMKANFISVGDKFSSVYFYLEGIQLQPQTCRGLSVQNASELTVTAQVEKPEVEIVTFSHQVAFQSTLVKQVQTAQNHCYCQNCGNKLFKDHCTFSRVLPLPSENWSQYSDFWFCHNHGNDAGTVPNDLLPKENDCFVGYTYILLQISNIKLGATKISKNGCIRCWRCHGQIGEMLQMKKVHSDNSTDATCSKFVKLYIHSILFKNCYPEEEKINCKSPWRRTEDFLCRFLMEQSRQYTSFRFVVQSVSESGETTDCLLWMLDTELNLYKAVSCLRRREVRVHADRVFKVMFQCSTMNSKNRESSDSVDRLITSWKKDDAVHCFDIPYSIFLQMIATLIHNTRCLPKSRQFLEGFHVSFLRYIQEEE
ncbi:hypothetical protein ScPMuIL_015436 [Solemya velum]